MENRILAKANSLDIEFNDGRKPMGSDETLSESLPKRELPLSLVICSQEEVFSFEVSFEVSDHQLNEKPRPDTDSHDEVVPSPLINR